MFGEKRDACCSYDGKVRKVADLYNDLEWFLRFEGAGFKLLKKEVEDA